MYYKIQSIICNKGHDFVLFQGNSQPKGKEVLELLFVIEKKKKKEVKKL